jgi:hypothetical protein
MRTLFAALIAVASLMVAVAPATAGFGPKDLVTFDGPGNCPQELPPLDGPGL